LQRRAFAWRSPPLVAAVGRLRSRFGQRRVSAGKREAANSPRLRWRRPPRR